MAKKHVGCSCQNKINGMKRKNIGKISQKGVTQMITADLLPVVAGYVGGNMLVNQFANNLPIPGRWVKLGVGAILGVTQKGMLSRVGLGLATAGAVELVGDAINAPGMGLLPPGQPSYFLNGVPEAGEGVAIETPLNVKVA